MQRRARRPLLRSIRPRWTRERLAGGLSSVDYPRPAPPATTQIGLSAANWSQLSKVAVFWGAILAVIAPSFPCSGQTYMCQMSASRSFITTTLCGQAMNHLAIGQRAGTKPMVSTLFCTICALFQPDAIRARWYEAATSEARFANAAVPCPIPNARVVSASRPATTNDARRAMKPAWQVLSRRTLPAACLRRR
jgi:hypothetical protein